MNTNTGFIFQSLPDHPWTEMIETISGSPYSHCGILYDGAVLESFGPVGFVALEDFLARGRNGSYAIYTTGSAHRDRQAAIFAMEHFGTEYDATYDVAGAGMFCSKLLAVALARLGIAVPKLKLDDTVRARHRELLELCYSGSIPKTTATVTPGAVAAALTFVESTYPPLPMRQLKQ